jgi:hypothetical protein
LKSPEKESNILLKVKDVLDSKKADMKIEKGFGKGIYISEDLYNFLKHGNFGFIPKTEIPLNFLLIPLLEKRILSFDAITNLFLIYIKINKLSEGSHYKVNSDMEKYLEKYLILLEEQDKNMDIPESFKFNRHGFRLNRLPELTSQGILQSSSYTKEQEEELKSPEIISLLSKIRQIISDSLKAIV